MEIQPVGDMHAFIASLAERADRIRMYRLSSAPEIGIFWLNPSKTKILYGNCVPMPEGLDHGDFKISAVDHFSEWERLNKLGFLKEQGLPKSLRDDYALVPRGRVSYNKVASRYEVYMAIGFSQSTRRSSIPISAFPSPPLTTFLTSTTISSGPPHKGGPFSLILLI